MQLRCHDAYKHVRDTRGRTGESNPGTGDHTHKWGECTDVPSRLNNMRMAIRLPENARKYSKTAHDLQSSLPCSGGDHVGGTVVICGGGPGRFDGHRLCFGGCPHRDGAGRSCSQVYIAV